MKNKQKYPFILLSAVTVVLVSCGPSTLSSSSASSNSSGESSSSSSASSSSGNSASSASSSLLPPTSSAYVPAYDSHYTKEAIFAAAEKSLVSPTGLDFTMNVSHYDDTELANDYETRTGSIRYYGTSGVYEGKQSSTIYCHALNADGSENGQKYLLQKNEDWDQYYLDGSVLKNVLEYHSTDYGYGANWERDTSLDQDSPFTIYSEWGVDGFHNLGILKKGLETSARQIEDILLTGAAYAKSAGETSVLNGGVDTFSYWEGVEGDQDGKSYYTLRYDVADSTYAINHREFHIVVDSEGKFEKFTEIHTLQNGSYIPYYIARTFIPSQKDNGAYSGTRYVKPTSISESQALYYTDNSLPTYLDTEKLTADTNGNIAFTDAIQLLGRGHHYSEKAKTVKDVIETSATTALTEGLTSLATVSDTGVEIQATKTSNFYYDSSEKLAFYNEDKSAKSEDYTQQLSVDSSYVLSSLVKGADETLSLVEDSIETLNGYYTDDYIFTILSTDSLSSYERYLPFDEIASDDFADTSADGAAAIKSATKDATGLITIVGYTQSYDTANSPLVTVTFQNNQLLSFDYSHVVSVYVNNVLSNHTLHETATFTY